MILSADTNVKMLGDNDEYSKNLELGLDKTVAMPNVLARID